MGREVLVRVDGDPRDGDAVAACVPPWFRSWEARFDPDAPGSELRRLMRSAGAPFPASFALFDLVRAVRDARASALLGPVARPAASPSEPARGVERLVSKLAVARAAVADAPDVLLDEPTRTITIPAGRVLDLAHAVRPWAADRAAARLAPLRAALVDVGDAVALSGARAGASFWPIVVSDPLTPEEPLLQLAIASGGVATVCAASCREGGHVSGVLRCVGACETPVPYSVASVTVVGPSALDAALVARFVLRSGPDAGLAWLDANPPFAGLVVLDDGHVRASEHLYALLAARGRGSASVA